MDHSSKPIALKGVILKGSRSSKKSGFGIFRGFQIPWRKKNVFLKTFQIKNNASYGEPK